jgi:hypothetical protein
MGVERVDYSSNDEFQQALAEESRQYNDWIDAQWQPKIVPCYFCGAQCYESGHGEEDDICSDCFQKTQVEKLILLHKKQSGKK